MNQKEILEILNSRWGQGFLFVILFIVVMFAVSSGQYCDLQISKAVDYVRVNECNIQTDKPYYNINDSLVGGFNLSR